MDESKFWSNLRIAKANNKKLTIKDNMLLKYKEILKAIDSDIKLYTNNELTAEKTLINISCEVNKLLSDWKIIEGVEIEK